MNTILKIDGKDVGMRATARTPRLYRFWTGRDMIVDMANVTMALAGGEALSTEALTTFEDVAYTMARQYDESITCTADEWLDQFDMMSIYDVWPQILDIWIGLQETTAEQKKK